MQQMRDCANLSFDFPNQHYGLRDSFSTLRVEPIGLLSHRTKIHANCGYKLPHAIVHLACDMSPLLVLHLQQASGEITQSRILTIRLISYSAFEHR
jgi:hypothetical protein